MTRSPRPWRADGLRLTPDSPKGGGSKRSIATDGTGLGTRTPLAPPLSVDGFWDDLQTSTDADLRKVLRAVKKREQAASAAATETTAAYAAGGYGKPTEADFEYPEPHELAAMPRQSPLERVYRRPVKPADTIRHGTLAGYRHDKCRCDPCRQANRDHIRAYRAGKRVA